MKTSRNFRFGSLMLTLLFIVMILPAGVMAAQAPVKLGSTESYAVLAASAITFAGSGMTTINGEKGGDVGIYPGTSTSVTGLENATISGTVHTGDANALAAQTDLLAAYNDAAGRGPVTRIPSELGGSTLKPGVYDSADGKFGITGTLTLDAEGDPDGVFVFLTASTLVTETNSNIELLNSARFCRIFWKVSSSATLGTYSHFVGHILAEVSITATTGATIQGQLLARTGAVTLDNNTITNGICAEAAVLTPTPTPAVITLVPTLTAVPTLTVTPTLAAAPIVSATPTVTPAATTSTVVTTTGITTITPTGESNENLIIGLIMLAAAATLILGLRKSRRQNQTVTQNDDYRMPTNKK